MSFFTCSWFIFTLRIWQFCDQWLLYVWSTALQFTQVSMIKAVFTLTEWNIVISVKKAKIQSSQQILTDSSILRQLIENLIDQRHIKRVKLKKHSICFKLITFIILMMISLVCHSTHFYWVKKQLLIYSICHWLSLSLYTEMFKEHKVIYQTQWFKSVKSERHM